MVPTAVGYLFQVRSDATPGPEPVRSSRSGPGLDDSPKLSESTRFWLDVIDSSSGADVTIATVALTVPLVGIPTIGNPRASISGLNAILRWTTVSAASCTVRFDGQDHISGAPADTFDQGFPVYLGLGPTAPDVSVVAVSESGEQSDPFSFGVLRPGPSG